MAFTPPTFNLPVDIYDGTNPQTFVTPRLSVLGNLAIGRRVQQFYQDHVQPATQQCSLQMGLLLPAGTDLHDSWQGFTPDAIEIPSGSGRYYGLVCYDDVGKGFTNEYRMAIVTKIGQVVDPVRYVGLFWPTPVP
jgi:hypothetical protein